MSKKRHPKSKQDSADASQAASDATPAAAAVENQTQRRLKYGANVSLAIFIVVTLAFVLIWLAQARDMKLFGKHFSLHARPDLTSDSSNTLKPQTVAILQDLDEKVTLVSLYPKLKQEERGEKEDTYDRVVNILQQYHDHNPDKISVQVIDPIAEPAKLDAWIGQLKREYGKEIPAYEDLLRGFPKTVEKIRKSAGDQVTQMQAMVDAVNNDTSVSFTREQGRALNGIIMVAMATLQQFPPKLEEMNGEIKAEMEKKIPDYESAKDNLAAGLTLLSKRSQMVAAALTPMRDDKTMPKAVQDYAKKAVPEFSALKGICDDTLALANKLGKLKLDEIRRKLIPPDDTKSPPPAIVVVGKEDIRVIDFDSVWKSGATTSMLGNSDEKPKLRFAGEQQITRAILALSQHEQKTIAFVRDGPTPLIQGTDPEDPMGGAIMSDIAERLRSYNFKVIEKDLGLKMRAMQAMQMAQQDPENMQMRMQAMRLQQMARAEHETGELNDATWVVFPSAPGNMVLGQRLKEHLEPQPAGGDLSVDAKDQSAVRSSSHTFAPDDIGRAIEISAGAGWTTGRYRIQDVKDGAAHLDRSPAAGKATDATWEELQGVDLSVDPANDRVVHSDSRPFTAAARGEIIRVKAGGAWKAGRYKIVEVENQTAVNMIGAPTGGTFVISVASMSGRPQDTKPIRSDAPAAEVQAALMGLSDPSMEQPAVMTVTGKPSGPWIIHSQADPAPHYSMGASTLTGGTMPKVEFSELPAAVTLDQSPAAADTKTGAWDVAPGGAICLMSLQCDDLAAALSDYGLQVNTNEFFVHEKVEAGNSTDSSDFIEQARRFPPIYVLNSFGDHPIAKPLNGLDAATQTPLRVARLSAAPGSAAEKIIPGVSDSFLLPIPTTPRSWVETDLSVLRDRHAKFEYHDTGISPPFYVGATAERVGCGKLVVLGSQIWVFNGILRILDPKMEKQHLQVAQFPGNGELFTNAVFWLNGQDQMLALSPAALDTARIAQIGETTLSFWRIGVFLIGLPLAALACGLFVYQARRD